MGKEYIIIPMVINGNKYESDVKNFELDGKEIYYWNNGNKYDGYFKNNKKEGKGILYINDIRI